MRILDADALLKMINSKKGMIGCTGLRNYINVMAKDDKDIVKREKGKWIYPTDVLGFCRCECCGALWGRDLYENRFFKYCPRCGADMRGEECK
jgi:hypothetical protein